MGRYDKQEAMQLRFHLWLYYKKIARDEPMPKGELRLSSNLMRFFETKANASSLLTLSISNNIHLQFYLFPTSPFELAKYLPVE